MSAQTRAEQSRLHAEWLATDPVQAFAAAVREHAAQSTLTGIPALNETMAFANAWLREHGDLPDSGIREF